MKRFLIAISYDGKKFHGFQYQKDLKTVEGVLKEKLKELMTDGWQALSRTDKGVSAKINYVVANFKDNVKEKDILNLNKELEKEGIKILFVERVPINLPLRGLAKYKVYKYYLPKNLETYYVFNGEKNLKLDNSLIKKLDFSKVDELKKIFKGNKLVINFSKRDKTKKHSYITNFYEIDIKEENDKIVFTIKGDKFFWEEVRRLINIFMSYLSGYLSKEKLEEMLKEKKEQKPKAYPAEFLVLEDIKLDI